MDTLQTHGEGPQDQRHRCQQERVRPLAPQQVHAGARTGWAFALGTLALTSLGIYLGRVDRLNSWDVLADPTSLLTTLGDRLGSPLDDGRFVGLVSGMAGALVLAYAVLHALGWLRPYDERR